MALQPPHNNYSRLTPRQLDGSEYGGTDRTRNTVQPKGSPDALTAGELLRLGYLVGDTSDVRQETPLSLEDRRQMLGLKSAGDIRPLWLAETGRVSEAELLGVQDSDDWEDYGFPGGY